MSPNLELSETNKEKKFGFRAENEQIFYWEEKKTRRVRKGEKRKLKNKNFSLRSTEFHRSEFVSPRTKVHLLDEGHVWEPKTQDFVEDSSEEFGKSKVSGLGSVHGTS